MKHVTHAQVAKPVDFYTMLGMHAPPPDYAERALRAWLDGAQVMQAEAAEFVSARAGKDMAALSEWSQCKTPTDALEMQARYAGEAIADYLAESQRMWTLMAAAGRHGAEVAK
jgi:Phasin protein